MLDRKTIEKAIKKAAQEERNHLRVMQQKGNEIGAIGKRVKIYEDTIETAQDKINELGDKKSSLVAELSELKKREGEIKGTKAAFQEMLELVEA